MTKQAEYCHTLKSVCFAGTCKFVQLVTIFFPGLHFAPKGSDALGRDQRPAKLMLDSHTHIYIYTQMVCNDFALWIPQLRRNSIRQTQVVVDKISFFNIVTRLCLHPSCEMSPPPYFVIKKVEVTGFRICCFRLWGYIIIVPPNVRHNLKQLMDISHFSSCFQPCPSLC